ncbi:hypothetical protein GQ44DRAFT_776919 [Phaeosphaeriaceae sp. PMI808]|nr:hypothetical protein GQ44DRAFT_776919 [Phaeosphaeriaceae sp. PMI808]
MLSAAAAVATVSAKASRNAVTLNQSCDKGKALARVINRCDYPVYLWSVYKGDGCPTDEMVVLNKGESYSENYEKAWDGKFANDQGVSIKISKNKQCKGGDITQLEYFLDNRPQTNKAFQLNYLDVSYVDCLSGDCPTKNEGYYLQAGTQAARTARTSADGSWCPILACKDAASCATMSYILPDDVQTKSCDFDSSMEFYMCGSQPPSADDNKPAPASSKQPESSAPKPATTSKAPSNVEYKANVAAVTNAPEVKEPKAPKVKTKVVYVTAYEYVNAKRHEHAQAHARRHQPFHA